MKATLVGVKTLDFKSDDGKQISGTNLFVMYKSTGVEGFECRKLFVNSSNYFDVITIDPVKFLQKEVDIDVGFGGKVLCVSAV